MKVKICRHCKTRNPVTEDYCIKCKLSIENIKPTDEETEQVGQEEENPEKGQVMVKVCEYCGYENPTNAGICQKCNEDLTGIIPQPRTDPQKADEKTEVTLIAPDGKMEYKLEPGETMIGRKGAMAEYLRPRKYVSREHAIITLSDGKVVIKNISNRNKTFVNGNFIASDPTELQDGDMIGLGGDKYNAEQNELAAFFVLRICECT